MSQEINDNTKTWESETNGAVGGWEDETAAEKPGSAEAAADDEGIDDNRRLHKATIMLLTVCVLGFGSVYLFKMKKKQPVISDQQKALETHIDLALQKFANQNEQAKTQELFKNSQEMVQMFHDYPANQQVSLDDLQRDPFTRAPVVKPEVKSTEDPRRVEKLRKELDQKFKTLKLQSIIQMSDGSKCLISGQIYSLGQIVAEIFTVKSIDEKSVILESQGVEYTLKM
jgi:hypothetical protein